MNSLAEIRAILDCLEEHSPDWSQKLRSELSSMWDENAALKARVEAAEEDAAKWRTLMSCERIRIMGRTLDYKHMGVEFWVRHRSAHPCDEFPQDECRGHLEEFVRRAKGEG